MHEQSHNECAVLKCNPLQVALGSQMNLIEMFCSNGSKSINWFSLLQKS